MKIINALSATVSFIFVLIIVYHVHTSYFTVNVVLYSAIFDVIIATALTGAVLCMTNVFRPLGNFERFQLIIIWLLAGYALSISVPTVIDRSLSFYILEKLQQRGGGIKQDNFDQIFTQEYIEEHHLVDVRLTEQLESGTIKIVNGCVKLTKRGADLASFSRYFRKNWLPKNRLLMGTYSDELTDPFRNSRISFDYTCK